MDFARRYRQRLHRGEYYVVLSITVLNPPIFAKVEAKIGILTDSRTGTRLNLPVMSETSPLTSSHIHLRILT